MQTKKKIKTVSLEIMIDKHIGKVGTPYRDAFEHELTLGSGGMGSCLASKFVKLGHTVSIANSRGPASLKACIKSPVK